MVTNTHVIKVKVGTVKGKDIVPKIQLEQSLTDLPVIGFDAGKILGRSGGFKPTVLRSAQENGIFITNDIEQLLNVLGRKINEIHNINLKP